MNYSLPVFDSIVYKMSDAILYQAKRSKMISFLDYIASRPREFCTFADIDCYIFDFIAAQYVWDIGYAYENAVKRPIGIFMKAAYDSLFNKNNFFEAYSRKSYEKVPVLLAAYSRAIIEHLKDVQMLSETECEQLIKRYCLRSIKDYSALRVPSNYPIKNCGNLLETVTLINEFEEHINHTYCNYPLLSSFGKIECVKVFYVKYNNIPFDLDD